MSLAAETREAVRQRPVLYDALRAGIVNYTAAAETLPVDGDRETIATALRRFAEAESTTTLDSSDDDRELTVRMESNTTLPADMSGLLGEAPSAKVAGDDTEQPNAATAVYATGAVDSKLLARVLDRLRIAEIAVYAAGVAEESMVVVVDRREGATTVQIVESLA